MPTEWKPSALPMRNTIQHNGLSKLFGRIVSYNAVTLVPNRMRVSPKKQSTWEDQRVARGSDAGFLLPR